MAASIRTSILLKASRKLQHASLYRGLEGEQQFSSHRKLHFWCPSRCGLYRSTRSHYNRYEQKQKSTHLPLSLGTVGILTTAKKLIGLEDEGEEKKEDEVVITIKRAILAQQDGRFHTAEQLLHVALKMAQERADMQAQTYIFDCMANFAAEANDLEKAEILFKETLQRLIASGEEQDSNAVVELSLKLVKIYAAQKKHDLATQGIEFCLNTQEKKIKSAKALDADTYLLWAMTKDWYASYLMSQKRLKEAQEQYEKALSICEAVNGPNHPQTLVLLNDLGSACSLQQNYDDAAVYLKKAVKIASIVESEELPVYYCNLGAVHTYRGEYDEAKDCCTKALRLARKHSNHEAGEQAIKCLANIQSESGK
ncbi:PREDICTED: tetratricopeptide repeat protein 19, mitochondrial-like [Priapulus caudatus]|uniref:Tetratricopeptide repeat protein 19, mitochondrial-like n=1 Tax=Priapulus caudatus TaxID=37621 RepID=A0ABM1DZ33_PRICU|nr:PREDICTED: tetratricopeptide repeat protein 19, mitochondrial-like [Priapulus caudatus]